MNKSENVFTARIPGLLSYFKDSHRKISDPQFREKSIQVYLLFAHATFVSMSFAQRLNALELLEHVSACKQQRKARRLKLSGQTDSYGYYDLHDDCIYISEYTLNHLCRQLDQPDFMDPGIALHFAHTLLHEGFHAFQFGLLNNSRLKSYLSRQWMLNTVTGYDDGSENYLDYFVQPIERDANYYANLELEKIFEIIERFHGPEPEFCRQIMKQEYSATSYREGLRAIFAQNRNHICYERKTRYEKFRRLGYPELFSENEKIRYLTTLDLPDPADYRPEDF